MSKEKLTTERIAELRLDYIKRLQKQVLILEGRLKNANASMEIAEEHLRDHDFTKCDGCGYWDDGDGGFECDCCALCSGQKDTVDLDYDNVCDECTAEIRYGPDVPTRYELNR